MYLAVIVSIFGTFYLLIINVRPAAHYRLGKGGYGTLGSLFVLERKAPKL